MKKHNRHIALVLLIVIIYPYISQSLHVLSHDHSHMHLYGSAAGTSNSNICTSADNDCHHQSARHNENSDAAVPGEVAFKALPDDQVTSAPCTLCEHEFAKFSLNRIYNIVFHREMLCTLNPLPYNEPSGIFTFSHISLRAPPRAS